MNDRTFFSQAQKCLDFHCPNQKTTHVFKLYWGYHNGDLKMEDNFIAPIACEAGRPSKPLLVKPGSCAKRDFKSHEGRLGLIHALCHIEFNAINLALDACVRFQGMPKQYYEDWLLVAKEEAYHFQLLKTHLNALGNDYGDFPAHDGLWEMAQKTAHSSIARMGCVPRLLEARGLDVAPQLAAKLKPVDANAATILEIILRDEEKHVLIGNRWFHYLCEQEGLAPLETFKSLVEAYAPNYLRKPLAVEARLRSGFHADELDWIEGVISQ